MRYWAEAGGGGIMTTETKKDRLEYLNRLEDLSWGSLAGIHKAKDFPRLERAIQEIRAIQRRRDLLETE